MMIFLSAFQSGWDLALLIFGLHLLVLGVLVFRSGNLLRMVGLFVVAAGLGYLVHGSGKLLSPDYTLTIAMFTFVGEPLLIFWLPWQGIRGVEAARENA